MDLVEFFESLDVPKFYNPNLWILEDCFKMLIQLKTDLTINDFDGCDLDIMDNFDETLLIHAVKTFKNRSLEMLIEKGASLEMANDKGITPIGQAIISRNAKALDILLENGANIHKNSVLDLSISNKVMKPMHYIAKFIRLIGVPVELQPILDILEKHKIDILD